MSCNRAPGGTNAWRVTLTTTLHPTSTEWTTAPSTILLSTCDQCVLINHPLGNFQHFRVCALIHPATIYLYIYIYIYYTVQDTKSWLFYCDCTFIISNIYNNNIYKLDKSFCLYSDCFLNTQKERMVMSPTEEPGAAEQYMCDKLLFRVHKKLLSTII